MILCKTKYQRQFSRNFAFLIENGVNCHFKIAQRSLMSRSNWKARSLQSSFKPIELPSTLFRVVDCSVSSRCKVKTTPPDIKKNNNLDQHASRNLFRATFTQWQGLFNHRSFMSLKFKSNICVIQNGAHACWSKPLSPELIIKTV